MKATVMVFDTKEDGAEYYRSGKATYSYKKEFSTYTETAIHAINLSKEILVAGGEKTVVVSPEGKA